MRGDMIWVYKIIHGLVRIDSTQLFLSATMKNTRGHALKLYKNLATKLHRIRSFSARVVNDWNNLLSEIVEAPTLNVFKNLPDKHWNHKQYQYDSHIYISIVNCK